MSFHEEMIRVADELTVAGIRAFLDISDANPPGVLIQPPAQRFRFRRGDADLDMQLVVIVGNNDARKALEQCSNLVDEVQLVLGDRATTGQPADVFLAEQSGSIRAYALTYSTTLRTTRGTPR